MDPPFINPAVSTATDAQQLISKKTENRTGVKLYTLTAITPPQGLALHARTQLPSRVR